MSRLERLGRALLSALVVSACGSRSALPEASPSSTGTGGSDGGVDPCAAPALPMQCAADILAAPAGDEVWSSELPVGNLSLLGPVAADEAGSTYYLGAESALYVKTVYALDACGALRWQVDVSEAVAASGYVPQVMVAGGHLLLVGIGNILALELDTGAQAFVADLNAFAKQGGLGEAPGKVMCLGYTAADASGTAYTAVANDLDLHVVAVTKEGAMHAVAKVDHYLGGGGYPLGAQQLALNAARHIVLAGDSGSEGTPIRAFTPKGKLVFEGKLPSFGLGQGLAGGPDYMTGRGLWILNFDGTLRNSYVGGGPTFISWGDGPTLIDGQGELFSIGSQHLEPGSSKLTFNLLGRFTPSGEPVWSATLDPEVRAGPVLGDTDQLFLTLSTGFEPATPQSLAAFSPAGQLVWQRSLPPSGPRPSYWLLLNTAGALTVAIDRRVHAYSSGGKRPPRCAYWPTPKGDLGQRVAAREK